MVVKMFPRAVGVFLSSAVLLSQTLRAAETSTDDAAPDANALSQEIRSFAANRDGQKKAFLKAAEAQLDKVIQQNGSAGNFVLECNEQVQFKDVKGGQLEDVKWRKDNQKLFSDRELQSAAMLHLRYLVLTLQRAEVGSSEPMQQVSWDYLADLFTVPELLVNAGKDPKAQGRRNAQPGDPAPYIDQLLNGPVTGGWVATTLGLNGQIGVLKNWEPTAGNFIGILEQNIQTTLRDKKDPRLLATWDYEAKYLGTMASSNPDTRALTKFQQQDYPRIMWKKADDTELLGMPNKALEIRVGLAKNFPNHPDFDTWTGVILSKLDAMKKASEELFGSTSPNGPDGSAPATAPAAPTGTSVLAATPIPGPTQ